jgi:hypothetical protein
MSLQLSLLADPRTVPTPHWLCVYRVRIDL